MRIFHYKTFIHCVKVMRWTEGDKRGIRHAHVSMAIELYLKYTMFTDRLTQLLSSHPRMALLLFFQSYMKPSQASLSSWLLAVASSYQGCSRTVGPVTSTNGLSHRLVRVTRFIGLLMARKWVPTNQVVLTPTSSLTSTAKGLLMPSQSQSLSTMLGEAQKQLTI